MQEKTTHAQWPHLLPPSREFSLQAEPFCLEGLEFDVWFFEGVVKAMPDSVECLTFLGHAHTVLGRYHEGLQIDRRLARLRPRDPLVHYNLACSHALLEDTDAAIRSLRRAVNLGYCEVDHMKADDDLASIRGDDRYEALVQRMCQLRNEPG